MTKTEYCNSKQSQQYYQDVLGVRLPVYNEAKLRKNVIIKIAMFDNLTHHHGL